MLAVHNQEQGEEAVHIPRHARESQGQLCEARSFPPPLCGFQGSSSSHQSGSPGKSWPAEPSLWLRLCWGFFDYLFICFPRQDPALEDALSMSGTLSAFCLLDFLLPLRCQLKRAILGNAFCSPPRLVDLSQSSHSLKLHTHLQDSLPPASP